MQMCRARNSFDSSVFHCVERREEKLYTYVHTFTNTHTRVRLKAYAHITVKYIHRQTGSMA